MMDIVGLETMYHVAAHWAEVRGDAQLKKNAEYLKAHFLDKKNLGVKNRRRFLQVSESGLRGAGLSTMNLSPDRKSYQTKR
jgi:3-hydroxyacyl-CoA dehydrogenase